MTHIPPFLITSLRNASKILTEDVDCRIKHVVSIGDLGDPLPKGYERLPERCKLRLVFSDITPEAPLALVALAVGHEALLPTREQVAQLVGFCKRIRDVVLFHCFAGISRSSASACIYLATKLGPGHEDDIMRLVRQHRPNIHPNKYLLELGDEVLGTKLLTAWRRAF